jgi:hypothetical protein
MSDAESEPATPDSTPLELVPRMTSQGYEPQQVEHRRQWVEEKTAPTCSTSVHSPFPQKRLAATSRTQSVRRRCLLAWRAPCW